MGHLPQAPQAAKTQLRSRDIPNEKDPWETDTLPPHAPGAPAFLTI